MKYNEVYGTQSFFDTWHPRYLAPKILGTQSFFDKILNGGPEDGW